MVSKDNCISMKSDGVAAIGQYIGVTKDAAGDMDLPTVSLGIVGITQQGVALGDTTTNVSVCCVGVTYALAGGVIAANTAGIQPLSIDATGRMVAHGGGLGEIHVANLIPSADQAAAGNTAAGDLIRVVLIQNPIVT